MCVFCVDWKFKMAVTAEHRTIIMGKWIFFYQILEIDWIKMVHSHWIIIFIVCVDQNPSLRTSQNIVKCLSMIEIWI
jgi:hypothetical protein